MIDKLKAIAGNKKWIEILFTLMLLSFPFGSFFLSFSIGFMTVYPFLMLLLLLAFLSFFQQRQKIEGLSKYYLWFMLLFFGYALAFLPFVDGKADAIIDLRSIVLMLLTAWVFISMRYFFGFEKWCEIILFAFYLLLGLVTLFAIVEISTGWHLEGAFTDKLAARRIQDSLSYVPVFLWDNPNTFVAYFLLIGGAIIMLEPKGQRKIFVVSTILILALMFSVIAEARLGQFAVWISAAFYFIYYLTGQKLDGLKRLVTYLLFLTFAILYVINSHTIIKEIPRSKLMVPYKLRPVYPVPAAVQYLYPDLTKPVEMELAENAIKEVRSDVVRNSNSERKALILNGIDFLKESNGLGAGPGQYRFRHENNLIVNYAFGNNGAHFWFVELVSQYGLLIFLPYCLILFLVFILLIKWRKNKPELAIGTLVGLSLLIVCSVLPSAFLILDINWIFTVILIIGATELSVKKLGATHD